MKTIKVNIYEFNELNESAQEKAIQDFIYNIDYDGSENEKTLNKFLERFPIKVTHWEYDQNYYNVSSELMADDEILDLTGVRLMKYVYNNHFHDVFQGKYYSLFSKYDKNPFRNKSVGKLKSRHSKVMFEFTCTLTGFYMDMDILQPLFDVMKGKYLNTGETYAGILEECLNQWGKACKNDMEGFFTDEHIRELIEINDYQFYADGSIYR